MNNHRDVSVGRVCGAAEAAGGEAQLWVCVLYRFTDEGGTAHGLRQRTTLLNGE